ncbi:EAL domain-containing protein [Glaciecola sp. 2405UD65-10]|uniref:EAL domain-containing protein n=1 Tax=Glaciecola sp. 2405UD65-10 TaxID=3397244 RepID=UPI003B5BA0CF
MFLNSLRSQLLTLSIAAILATSILLVIFAMQAYQDLYRQGASDDLNGLSENLSIDLMVMMSDEPDIFNIANLLLKLDQYENVRVAAVFDENLNVVQPYFGKVITSRENSGDLIQQVDFSEYVDLSLGMHAVGQDIIAFKRIGEKGFPLGYLLVVNDLSKPLRLSTLDLILSVFPFVIITLVVTATLIISLQNKAIKPLLDLSDFMRKIRKTKNYGLLAQVKGKKELKVLTEGFNSMMQEINTEVEKNRMQTTQLLDQQEQMQKLANFDSLTDLPNRQYFISTLSQKLEEARLIKHDLALLFFDLNGFKWINDSFGHEVGDKLLCYVANEISTLVNDKRFVSRLGGDEFLILVENVSSQHELLSFAKGIKDKLSQPIVLDGWQVEVGISIGIALASDANYSVSELIANADVAMYSSKAQDRSTCTLFVKSMMEDNKRKISIASALANAISNEEFTLFYQPKVDGESKIKGFEALIRWNNKELGFISPDEFITIAEQSGKIQALTLWVIQRVCKDVPRLLNIAQDAVISLNISAYDLRDSQLISKISTLFDTYEIDASCIEFELTESAYLENFDLANRFITQARNKGSFIALDDFGTGYSSLSYLTQISLDTLKIDKQFVDGIGLSKRSNTITKTIIEMAKQLDLQICAEGVETQAQASFLLENECQLLQGYLFSKPLPIEALEKQYNTA